MLFVIGIFYFIIQQTTQARSDSCPVSNRTVKEVNSCPENEEDWQEAATRKNCSAYASQCDEPDKLKYHCIINPFVNRLLEVCAYVQAIVGGKEKICSRVGLFGLIKEIQTL